MDQAERIIARFGGIRPMAAKLGIAVTTVQGWKERGSIPAARHAQILAAAEAEGLDLSEEDLRAGGPAEGSVPETIEPETIEPETIEPETIEPETIEPDFTEPDEPAEEVVAEPAREISPAAGERAKRARPPARAVLLGGLLGVMVAGGAGYAGWSMRDREPAGVPPELSQRIDAIAKRADEAGAQARAAETQARAAETQARAAETRARAAEKKIAGLAGLGKRLEAAETQARAAETRTRAAQASARATAEKFAGLARKQARLEAAGAGGGEEAARALAALKSELAQLAARLKATAPGEKLQALGAGLAALKTRLDELASRPRAGTAAKGNPGDKAALAALSKQIGKLSATLAGFDERLEATGARVAALGKRIAGPGRAFGRRLSELEKRPVSASGGRGAALIAGIGQLREAVRAGRAYSSELEAVTALAGKDPRLAEPLLRLVPRAGKGVPSAASLVARFGLAAPAIVRAGRIPEDGGWAARAWARARSVVIIRRIGSGVKGADTEAVVARAEARLTGGDIAGAAAMLKGLKGRAAEAAGPWLAAAGAHVEAARAVLALHRAALTLIEVPPGKPAPAKPKAAP